MLPTDREQTTVGGVEKKTKLEYGGRRDGLTLQGGEVFLYMMGTQRAMEGSVVKILGTVPGGGASMGQA